MKKFKVYLLIIACFYFFAFGALSVNAYDLTTMYSDLETINYGTRSDFPCVYTPNGTEVLIIEVYEELLPYELYYYDSTYYNSFPNAICIHGATGYFNCHSYAWYSQDVSSNHYWIENPFLYYCDYSYIEVATPRVGDIVCYYDDKGTPSYFNDDKNLHSGIVIDYYQNISSNGVCGDVNKVKVESKWGDGGLYQHMGDYCPYVSTYGGGADYVKYYRPRTTNTYTIPDDIPIDESFVADGVSTNIVDHYEMYELNVTNNVLYEFTSSSIYDLDIRLFDDHMQLVSYYDLDINDDCVHFVMQLSSNKTYYLRVAYEDKTQSGTIYTDIYNHIHTYTYNQHNSSNHQRICGDCGYVGYENHHFQYSNGNDVCSNCGYTKTHQHSYNDHYQWTNLTTHKSYCTCNSYITSSHVLPHDAFQNGNLYASCILCHGLAIFGETWHDGIGNYPHTVNGSFILPNGVIVLVDEDIEAFLNGTLVFIDPNASIDRNINHIEDYYKKE